MAIRRERMRLGDLLIKQNVLTEEELKKALELQKGSGKKIGEVLVDNGFITEEMIVRALQMQLGLKVVQLAGVTIPKEVRGLVSVDLLKKYTCIPFELDPYNANILHLAMADPMDMMAIDDISIVTNLQVEPYIATTRDIRTAIDRWYGASETLDAARRFTKEREQLRVNTGEETGADVSDAPIVQLVRSLLEQAIRQRASDVHIEALESKVRVRYRIDGTLYEKMVYDNSLLPAISTRIKIMGGMDISEKRKPQDGRLTIMVDRQEYDIRISSVPTVHGEKIVMRISSKLSLTKNKKELGLAPDELKRFDHMLSAPYGIIFVTGPTGSGKSTTLYTALSELNKEAVNIVTVEDPVEADIEGINQIQVNNKVNLTFASALRSILRQDPDIIMIGEIRDRETAGIAVQASITGHLVVSTLHTNNAAGTLNRMADMGVERYLIADSVVGVIAQRLVRKLCPHCRKKRLATEEEKRLLKQDTYKEMEIYEPTGCDLCNHTGYFGRTGVFEIMEVNEEIRNLIAEGGSSEELENAARRAGMCTLHDNGIRYVLEGITSIEEMLKVSYE
ncbi:Flp pilus assembly complex ATPase component [Blautia massiliensis]|uniref:GspE/PulE family protein n=1 Tax=Blautia TaxID=572511 RepID=UPI00156F17C5|nr:MULTISPECIES: ATPase, T2SS/T4P/T4SS family [Blautia]MCC2724757.1 Flp pilus assembly complex ATPase component TadA [Blautia sp. MSK22_86]NSF57990.1 Flp pilus assembly complex ATPase component [Blautia massiliensis (ex Durand et al. 2017)]NSK73408.1 Flp pilus assembly complex ATPase component [Blautia massiliensis (ex Durand et al. 2017)]